MNTLNTVHSQATLLNKWSIISFIRPKSTLYLAIEARNKDVVKALLEMNGTKEFAKQVVDDAGNTLLHLRALYGWSVEIAKLLLDYGADVDAG